MHEEPVPPDPERDENPCRVPDWMDDPAYLAMRAGDEDPGDLGLDEDPDDAPPPVGQRKAAIIAEATGLLDPEEAQAAEALVLDRAGSLTSPGLRAAINRAVMEVAPDKARKRREHAAKRTRVERWAEGSGNAGLAGQELPPAQVLAADQRVTAWAKELRKAGLEGGMDALRAGAYLDILLGMDSRPLGSRTDATGQPQDPAPTSAPTPGGPLAGMIPPGFAGQVTLTIPEATLTGRADRPGELGGIGPIDPDPEANTLIVTGSWHGIGRSQDRHRSVRPVQSTDRATRVPVRQDFGPRRQDHERGAYRIVLERVHLAT